MRRIIYNQSGQVIIIVGGDALVECTSVAHLDLPDEQYEDEFKRAIEMHVDVNTKEIVFDKLQEKVMSDKDYIKELENKLLEGEGLV